MLIGSRVRDWPQGRRAELRIRHTGVDAMRHLASYATLNHCRVVFLPALQGMGVRLLEMGARILVSGYG